MRFPTTEFQPMNALAPYLMALHQSELLAEAELARRARLASKSQPGVPAWRRSLGGALAYAARSLDPGRVEAETPASRRPALRRVT